MLTSDLLTKTNKDTKMDTETEKLWDYLIEYEVATEAELCLITSINGTNLESLESVLYCRTAYRSLDQILECEG